MKRLLVVILVGFVFLNACVSPIEPKPFPSPEGYSNWEEYQEGLNKTTIMPPIPEPFFSSFNLYLGGTGESYIWYSESSPYWQLYQRLPLTLKIKCRYCLHDGSASPRSFYTPPSLSPLHIHQSDELFSFKIYYHCTNIGMNVNP